MLKRLMIWLLNQFQKIVSAWAGRRDSARSQKHPKEISPTANSAEIIQGSPTRSDININTVAPVAQRVSLAPAVPVREAQDFFQSSAADTAISLEPIEGVEPVADTDTHRRLDATAAAIFGEESVVPAMPTAISELMTSDALPHAAADGVALPTPTVETQGGYQLPAIYDLLPAIEPEEPEEPEESVSLEQPAYLDSEIEHTAFEEISTSEETLVETVDSSDVAIVEPPILFSFDVYESATDEDDIEVSDIEASDIEASDIEEAGKIEEADETEETDEINKVEEANIVVEANKTEDISETEDVDLPVSSGAIAKNDDSLMPALSVEIPSLNLSSNIVDEDVADRDATHNDLADEEQASILDSRPTSELESEPLVAPEIEDSESVNPWLTVTPKTSQTSAQTVTQAAEIETKPGVVKLLFTIKLGNYHGYITPDDGSKDILFHQKYINADIFDKIERGTLVVATVKLMEGKAYATRVELRDELRE